MSHVDDGELTAYADGAYPANDPVALRIAAHLSTCGNCRTRLEQSHELRDRAAEILAFAAPAALAAPSFEALQAQAATSTRASRRGIPLAWAASIVLAIGLGWFGRDMLRFPTAATRSDMMVQTDEAPSTTETKQEAAPPTSAPVAAPATGQGSGARRQERTRDLAANRVVEEGKTAGVAADAAAQQNAAPPAVPAPSPAAPPPSSAAEVGGLARRTELANIAVTGVATEYVTAAEAERRGMRVLRIPELPIARVGLQGTTTIVEQVLPNETIVTLTVTHAETEPSRAVPMAASKTRESSGAARAEMEQRAALAPTAANIVVRVGNKSVTITGDLQPDSLRALGRKVR